MLKIRSLLTALLLATLCVGSVLAQSQSTSPTGREQSSPEQKPSADGQQNGDDQRHGTEQRPFVVKTISTPETQDEASRDAIYQQQRTANRHVVELGIGAIIFGALQTIALFFTFGIMRKTPIRQLRAYIFVETAVLTRNPNGAGSWEVHLLVKNFGATPARKLAPTLERDIKKEIGRDVLLPFSKDAKTQKPQIIAPGQTITIRCPMGNFDWGVTRAAGNKAYVWGRIDYVDAFKRKRWVTLQMVHDLHDVDQFYFCEAGNDSRLP
jgi:hypothetical protein